MSKRTLEYHHGKHHAGYVKKLNELTDGTPYADMKLEAVIKGTAGKPEHKQIFNNAAQIWNHDFFWKIMGPAGSTQPSGALAAAIETYGGLDKLKEDFNGKGAGQFGSGWAWVIADSSGALKVVSTPNQDNPLMDDAKDKGTPILANDVWEHAYYLTYKNDRPGYLKAWWDVVNWDEAGRIYDSVG